MEKCPNKYIINPVPARVIDGPYKGYIGWADKEPNKVGNVGFCNQTGKCPFQYVTKPENIEYLDE